MKSTYIVAVIEAVVFLIPLGTLIWKAAKLSARVEHTERRIDKLTEVVRNQDNSNTVILADIQKSLNTIKISIAKLETKLEDREKWKDNKNL